MIARIAAQQRGVVARRQLLAAGISRRRIQRRVAGGHLHALHRGVYAVGHAGTTPSARRVAALLAMGRGAVLTHWSAAATWGLAQPPERLIDVTVPNRKRQSRPGIRFHRLEGLEPRDVRRREGLPVTSVARTLLDVASLGSFDRLTRMYNDARIQRIVRDSDLTDLIERSKGNPGVPSLRLLLAHGSPGPTRSVAEDRFLSLVRSAGLPIPEANQHVAGHEVDFLWPAERLVVEVDGFAYHANREAFERDRRRDADLLAAGLRVLRLTWRALEREPEQVAARLSAALAP